MFRNITGEGHLSGGQSTASPRGNEITSPGLDSQESSWIGLLSVVSRPALSFLQKYLPGRAQNSSVQSDKTVGWIHGDVKKTFVDEENAFLMQLDDMMPAPHLTYLQCQHEGAAGSSGLPWLTAESLREMGIQDPEEVNLNLGYISSAKTVLSHVLLSSVSSQEMRGVKAGSKGRPWWGSLWGGDEENPHGKPLSDLSWTVTGLFCPQRPGSETKASAAFVQSEEREWTVGENTGPAHHKEEPANNGGLHTVQNSEKSAADHQLSIPDHLSSSEGAAAAAAACPEVTLLSPDQDNGYSSLEEEQFQICQLHMMKAPAPINKQPQVEDVVGSTESSSTTGTDMEEEETPEEEEEEEVDEEGEIQKDDSEAQELSSAAAIVTPKCQNKTIAFIMGCPCSDDDSSQSESSEDDDDNDDDDGFDSEGTSDLSNSSDEDDEDSESDSEAERLWNSLCHSQDPYNPRNFTARMHTGPPTLPRTIPIPSAAATTPSSSASSSPASPPTLPAPSPPSGSDTWDDSTSASEADEGESLRLWSSFSCSLDPYSPLNFQAPLRTQAPRTKAKKASQAPLQNPASPPKYRKEEAEERLDSGFSEPSTSTGCKSTKKVRFCDDVEEFFASCSEEEEDRRGPWEELARDRCRFLRRCQEVEQSIAFCLEPQHRNKVYERLQQCPDQHA